MTGFTKVLDLADLPEGSQRIVKAGKHKVALFHFGGKISALGNACLHKGGPLGLGRVEKKYDGLYVTCPWHGWEYNVETGSAPPGYHDQVARYDVAVEDGAVWVSDEPVVRSKAAHHDHSSIADLMDLRYETTPDSLNILGLSATNMNDGLPRYSTSEAALEYALAYAKQTHGAATRMTKLRELNFRHCEGDSSQHMQACTWPCSITEMTPHDGMTGVYRDFVLWADVVLLATPIRWGNASSLYYKMAERLNTVQNHITTRNKTLIRNKVAAFIITGGQDNIQQVSGQLMTFFTDLGFVFPPFSFLGWSRGWMAEDMDKNIMQFKKSEYIKRTARELVDNCIETVRSIKGMNAQKIVPPKPHRQDSPTSDIDNFEMNM